MGKPRQEVREKEYFKDIHFLYEILNKMRNVKEVKVFLKDMLTPCELRMFKRRWHMACLLDDGWDIRKVAQEAKASTSTVLRVKEKIENGLGGLKLALHRTRSDRDTREHVPSEMSPWTESFPNMPVRNPVLRWAFGTGKK
ncbi:hypothetical protein HZB97_03530 [Candidatus Gottesmanbacteria bacterium]|nr:hypothetical protein [Candidatus Gottesmanbacteria bacterium]